MPSRILVAAPEDRIAREVVECITGTPPSSIKADKVPWKIENKYYTADVEILVGGSAANISEDSTVQAVIFAFELGTNYRPIFIQQSFGSYDAEVCIATALPAAASAANTVDEDIEAIDDFFNQYGFELVNAAENPETSEDESDISGFARIHEALHAIMWPNLVRAKLTANRASRPGQLPVMFKEDDDDNVIGLDVDSLTDEMARSLFISPDGPGVDDREISALEAWLEKDEDSGWTPSTSTPHATVNHNDPAGKSKENLGFDDDFSAFVSAGRHIIAREAQEEAEAGDPWISSQHQAPATFSQSFNISSSSPFVKTTPTAMNSSQSIPEDSDGGEADDAFDLNQVLSVLQAMKEEISLIDDVEKRRKAAATATLGLVKRLGLSGEIGDEDDEGSDLEELISVN